MITLYDFETTFPGKGTSHYVWRVRLALNYKGLEHQTIWFKYAEIEYRSKALGIPPNGTRPDGSPFYTVPAIYDPSTNTYVADSLRIIEYLDATYPETPRLGVPGIEVLVAAFTASLPMTRAVLWPIYALRVIAHLDEKSSKKYQKSLEDRVQSTLEEFLKNEPLHREVWKQGEKAFGEVDIWFRTKPIAQTTRPGEDQPQWIMGQELKLPDIILASGLVGVSRILGEQSEEWRRIAEWNQGRWGNLLNEIKEYNVVH